MKLNKYDYYILSFVLMIFFGDYGGAYQPTRVIGFLFSTVLIIQYINSRFALKRDGAVLSFFIIFLSYCFLSLYWTSNRAQGIKEFVVYFSYISLFLSLPYCALKASQPLKMIIVGWCLLIITTIPFALVEIIYDIHFPISHFGSDVNVNYGGQIFEKKYASLTFVNYNGYVTFLTYSMPFLFSLLLIKTKIVWQIFIWILLLNVMFILFTNASRGGLLCLAISSFYFSFYYRKVCFPFKAILKYFLLLIILIVLFKYADVVLAQILNRFVEANTSVSEDSTRLELIYRAFKVFENSYFIGSGIGSIQTSMKVNSSDINIPHNLFVELFVQYGVVVFVYFIFLLYRLFKLGQISSSPPLRFLIICSLLNLPFSSVINSGYLLRADLWLLFSSLYTFLIIMKMNNNKIELI